MTILSSQKLQLQNKSGESNVIDRSFAVFIVAWNDKLVSYTQSNRCNCLNILRFLLHEPLIVASEYFQFFEILLNWRKFGRPFRHFPVLRKKFVAILLSPITVRQFHNHISKISKRIHPVQFTAYRQAQQNHCSLTWVAGFHKQRVLQHKGTVRINLSRSLLSTRIRESFAGYYQILILSREIA